MGDFIPGRNAEKIRCQAMRIIRGKIPASVRKELMSAVKANYLGRLKKDGLKPEIFFHPDHKHGALDRQRKEAEYSAGLIGGVLASGAERAEYDYAALAAEGK